MEQACFAGLKFRDLEKNVRLRELNFAKTAKKRSALKTVRLRTGKQYFISSNCFQHTLTEQNDSCYWNGSHSKEQRSNWQI